MKKVILIFIIAICTLSCKKETGTVTGVVTYFFNDYQGYKPDIASKVYITKMNVDTLELFLRSISSIEHIDTAKRHPYFGALRCVLCVVFLFLIFKISNYE